jgi:hypothetical protein
MAKSKRKRILPKRESVKQAQFLATYRTCGNIRKTAELTKIERRTHYKWMDNDPSYKERFMEAHEDAIESLEAEALRRAVDGVEKPVFGSGGQGVGTVKVGSIREYSDTLLIFLLKGAKPEKYRDNAKVQLEGSMNHTGNVQIFIPENGR